MQSRASTFTLIAALVFALVTVVPPLAAQGEQRCFAETGHCIAGPIRAYWERNGGLAVFGFPIGPQVEELEIQPDGSVSAGRLGVERLQQLGTPWQPGSDQGGDPVCSLFAETGYAVCGPFADYWRRNGDLTRFGLPVTGAFATTIEGLPVTVQYFERRRFELHGGSQVLLGLLGREVVAAQQQVPAPIAAAPAPTAEPTAAPTATPTAVPTTAPSLASTSCDPSYPTVCIPPPPPDLDCGDIPYRRFKVVGSAPHRFDRDRDGIGCEN